MQMQDENRVEFLQGKAAELMIIARGHKNAGYALADVSHYKELVAAARPVIDALEAYADANEAACAAGMRALERNTDRATLDDVYVKREAVAQSFQEFVEKHERWRHACDAKFHMGAHGIAEG